MGAKIPCKYCNLQGDVLQFKRWVFVYWCYRPVDDVALLLAQEGFFIFQL
nr:MAG TPA: Protein of unknown function (DUF3624) [Caudoviricetes sp.]